MIADTNNIHGFFFEPFYVSENHEDVSIYRYKALQKANGGVKKEIYVVLKSDSVEFQVQGEIEATDSTQSDNWVSITGQSQILTIPLTGKQDGDVTKKWGGFSSTVKNYKQLILTKQPFKSYSSGDKYWDNPGSGIPKRILLLDFLFDFFNSPVFFQSSRYNAVKESLLAIPFLKAIYLKCDLLYKRSRLDGVPNIECEQKNTLTRSFAKAWEKWLGFVTNQENRSLFSNNGPYNEWLSSKDKELEVIAAKKTMIEFYGSTYNDIDFPDLINRIAKSQLRDYKILGAYNTFWNGIIKYRMLKLGWKTVPILIFFFLGLTYSICVLYNNKISLASVFFVLSFVVAYLIILFLWDKPLINLTLPKLQMGIVTSWVLIITSTDIWQIGFDMPVNFYLLLAAGFLLFLIFVYTGKKISNTTGIKEPKVVLCKAAQVIFPGLLFSLFMGILWSHFGVPKMIERSGFFSVENKKSSIYELDSLKVLKESLNDTVALYTKKIWRIEEDSLFASFYLKKDSIKKLKDESKEKVLKCNQVIDAFKKRIDTVENMLEGQSIIDAIKSEHYHYKDDNNQKGTRLIAATLWLPWFNKTVILFPGFLLLTTIFSLFAGIFLTLLFDDKSLTEPL